jgi:hypothetical protein
LSPLGRILRFFLRGRERPAPETGPARQTVGVEPEVNYFAYACWLIDSYGSNARAEAVRLMHEATREADPDDPDASRDWLIVSQAIALLTGDSAAARN